MYDDVVWYRAHLRIAWQLQRTCRCRPKAPSAAALRIPVSEAFRRRLDVLDVGLLMPQIQVAAAKEAAGEDEDEE